MGQEIRFGDFVREVRINQQFVSYNDLTPQPQYDAEGREIPYVPPKVKLRRVDITRILAPYISERLIAQIKAVVDFAQRPTKPSAPRTAGTSPKPV